MDVRSHPKGGEEFFEDTQEKGVLFTRSKLPRSVLSPEELVLRGEDTLFGEPFEREFDLAVLSIGMSAPVDSKLIATLLKITLDKDKFFLEAHIKLRPFDTAVKGIFIAGHVQDPRMWRSRSTMAGLGVEALRLPEPRIRICRSFYLVGRSQEVQRLQDVRKGLCCEGNKV